MPHPTLHKRSNLNVINGDSVCRFVSDTEANNHVYRTSTRITF
jgi:hypothetical protein